MSNQPAYAEEVIDSGLGVLAPWNPACSGVDPCSHDIPGTDGSSGSRRYAGEHNACRAARFAYLSHAAIARPISRCLSGDQHRLERARRVNRNWASAALVPMVVALLIGGLIY